MSDGGTSTIGPSMAGDPGESSAPAGSTVTSPPAREGKRSPSRRRRWLVAGAAVLVLAGTVIAVSVARHSRHAQPSRRAVPSGSRPSPGAAQLHTLLTKEAARAFHATYRIEDLTATSPATVGGVELWRDLGHVREDTSFRVGGTTVQEKAFIEHGRGVLCMLQGSRWTCRPEAAPTSLLEAAEQQVAGRQVAQSDQRVAGLAAQCFTGPANGGTFELCATAEGIPVRLSSGSKRIVLTSLSRSVPASVFVPPA